MTRISHIGEIIGFDNNKAVVKIQEHTACSDCALSSCCGAKKSPIVQVFVGEKDFNKGEKVLLSIDDKAEKLGILLSYVLPSIIIFASLFVTKYMQLPDDICAVITILCVVLYYPSLLLFKKKINRQFDIMIRKR